MLHNHLLMFKKRENIVEIEEGKLLSPKFDNDGLNSSYYNVFKD